MSTDEQDLGLEVQRRQLTEACAARGWDLAGLHVDDGWSARDLERPAIREALAILRAGVDAQALVVAKLDRLSRSVADFAGLMDTARREGWAIVCLDLGLDTSTPAGELMANVLATFAQFERRLIGQRTREALAVLKANGVHVGRPRSTPDSVAERARGLHHQGLSLGAIGRQLEADGVPTSRGGSQWWPSTVRALLARTGS